MAAVSLQLQNQSSSEKIGQIDRSMGGRTVQLFSVNDSQVFENKIGELEAQVGAFHRKKTVWRAVQAIATIAVAALGFLAALKVAPWLCPLILIAAVIPLDLIADKARDYRRDAWKATTEMNVLRECQARLNNLHFTQFLQEEKLSDGRYSFDQLTRIHRFYKNLIAHKSEEFEFRQEMVRSSLG